MYDVTACWRRLAWSWATCAWSWSMVDRIWSICCPTLLHLLLRRVVLLRDDVEVLLVGGELGRDLVARAWALDRESATAGRGAATEERHRGL